MLKQHLRETWPSDSERARTVEGHIMVLESDQPFASASPAKQYYRRQKRQRARRLLTWGFLFLLLSLNSAVFGYIFLWSRATIHIHPSTIVEDTEVPVMASLSPKNETESQIRRLSASSASPSVLVHPTGILHIPATTATGMLMWYNQEPFPQTIPAGTPLTSTSGLPVAPDRDVIVPASIYGLPGQISSSAHALQDGARGNIAAYTINALCTCGGALGIRVTNQAFFGGQDSEKRRVFQASDIGQAVAPLIDPTRNQTIAQLQKLMRASEHIGTPHCASQISTDHPSKNVARMSAVITFSCAVSAFNKDDVRRKAVLLFRHHPAQAPDAHYQITTFSPTRTFSIDQDDPAQGKLQIIVRIAVQWHYQMNQEEMLRLQKQLAGKSSDQAVQILARATGVGACSIEQWIPWLALPNDPGRITFQFVRPVAPHNV
jgi:hypothetical protein